MPNSISNAHVLLVANTLWSVYNFRKGLIKKLIADGNKVTVVGPPDEYIDDLRWLGCNVEEISISSQGKNPFIDLLLVLKLKSVYDRLNPDFIFHYTIKPNIYGSIAARLSKKKSIAITTGLGYVFTKNSILTKFISLLYSFALRFSSEVWFLNEDDLSVFLKNNIVRKDRAFILDSEGVDTDFFAPIAPHEEYNNLSGFTFLLVARMLWDKGIGIYVEAAKIIKAQYPNVRFQLLGGCDVDNPEVISRQLLEQWHKSGVIEYLGEAKDVRANINNSTAIVLPSFYREGVPRTLMEAASMSKPIITTDNVGCKNVVIDEVTGYLCKTKDVGSLVSAMSRLINLSPDERLSMGMQGRLYMKNRFDEKIVIQTYLNALEKYLGCKNI